MDQVRGRGRGRGRGSPRGTPSRSAGRQFWGSAAHSHRRYEPQSGRSSRGGREKFVYVPKRQEGPNSPDATTGVSEEASSVIASGLGHNGIGNSPLFSSPLGFSSHTDEEKSLIEHISRELKCNEVTKTSDFPNKLDISCQQVEDTLPLKHGDTDEDGPLSIKDPKTLASDGKSENSKSAATLIEHISRELKCNEVTKTSDFPNKLDISCQQVEDTLPLKHGDTDEDGPLSIKDPKTLASDGKSENSKSAATLIEHISRELKCNEVTLTSDFPNKLDISRQQVEDTLPLKHGDTDEDGPLSIKDPKTLASDGKSENSKSAATLIEHISRELKCNEVTLTSDFPNKLDISCQQVEDTLPLKHGDTDEDGPLSIKDPKTLASDRKSENSKSAAASVPFDICPPKTSAVKLKPPLLVQNRERKNEMKRTEEGLNGKILRSGMVLLKNYISPSNQAKIVKQCRDLGLGHGGFYQPGYREGAKLHLNMMCLGKNWDPQTCKYEDYRPTDGAKPPVIPKEFYELVKKALKDSHSVIEKESEARNAEELLPHMKPDICIVNFYSTNGRLGLHQDRDESPESIRKGLPVVSFSIGDTAEFRYGDQREVDKAAEVSLESGDVLIFGGDSRNVFHGVTAIRSNTAPKSLLEESNLRAGRLNLTFRQY